jgi:hypothetical protein
LEVGVKPAPAVIVALALIAVGAFAQGEKPPLTGLRVLFVKGNNEAATKMREMLSKGKGRLSCLRLASKEDAADGTLEVSVSNISDSGALGSLGRRHSSVSATLTTRSGDLIWSGDRRFSDAPFMSGAKSAADILLHDLAKQIGCPKEDKKK